MSYPINQKINMSAQPTMGINTPLSNVTAPQLQNLDVHQDVVQNSALRGVASQSKDKPWLMPAIILPTWLAMGFGMDRFNKACRGKYEDSAVGRVQAWSEKVGDNKFFQSNFMKKFEKSCESSGKWFKEKVIPKNKILTAMFTTPSQPTNQMVLMMKDSTFGEIRADAIQKLGEYVQDGAHQARLKEIGLTAEEFQAIKANPRELKNTEKLMKICKNAGEQNVDMVNIGKIPWSEKFTKGKPKYLSDFIPGLRKVFGRQVYFTEYYNKMHALQNGSKNLLGKKVPKVMLKLIEGLTNGTAGGKIAIFMGAIFIADAIKKTIEAPKGHGEKRKTFTEEFVYNEAMYLTMPLGLKLMHGLGGLQYIGVSKDNVEKFRAEQKAFNDNVVKGVYKDKKVYSAEVKRIKQILKPEYAKTGVGKFFKGIVYKPLSWAAKVLTSGLENFAPFNPKGISKDADLLTKAGQFIKHGKAFGTRDISGNIIRFGFYLMAIAPFLGNLAIRVSDAIFGRPSKSLLDKEPDGPKEPVPGREIQPMSNQPTQPVAIQQNSQVPQTLQQSQPVMQPLATAATAGYTEYGRENLLAAYKANQMNQAGMMPSNSPTRNYIPSSEPVRLQQTQKDQQQNMVAGAAIERADRAGANASKYLGGHH